MAMVFSQDPIDSSHVQKIKVCISLVPVIYFFVLLNSNFLFLPTSSSHYRPGHPGGQISVENASLLVRTADPQVRWRILTDTLSWATSVPYRIDQMMTRVELENVSQPTIWLRAKGLSAFGDLQRLIFSSSLNTLTWPRSTSGSLTFWQRSNTQVSTSSGNSKTTVSPGVQHFATLGAFIQTNPDLKRVGSIGIDPFALTHVSHYVPSHDPIVLAQTFRGDHDLYIYASHENLSLNLEAASLNRKKGSDRIILRVTKLDQVTGGDWPWIHTQTVALPQGKKDSPTWSSVKFSTMVQDEGLYLVQIRSGDDVIWRNLTSPQHYINFRQAYLAEGPAYGSQSTFHPATILTNGSSVSIAPDHNQGFQDLKVDGKNLRLRQVRIDQTVGPLKSPTSLTIMKTDVRLRTDGLLAFAPAAILPTSPMRELDPDNLNVSNIDYLVADYQVPTKPKNFVVEQTYHVGELNINPNKQLMFSLFSPGLLENDYILGLNSIHSTLIRGAFPWAKIQSKIQALTK